MVTVADYGNFETAWCPGCGNFAILGAVKEALAAAGLAPHQVLFVSGIGQAAKAPHYLNANVFTIAQYTPWVKVAFAAAPGFKVHGICRFYLKQFYDRFEMYCSSIQIDPDKPVMPIAHPTVYSSYLARQQGAYPTLGLAEDTWSLSEGLMDEDAFLRQVYDIHAERETMFFDALRKVRGGMVVCVFDGPDRIQHMFWRFLEEDHPALRGRANSHAETIRDMYVRMDELVGKG